MKHPIFEESLQNLRARLNEPLYWFPFPALIAFGLVIVLRGQTFSGLNHRVGTTANVVELTAEELHSPGIWLSITEENEQIAIVTDDHRRFQIPLATQNLESLEPFVRYLTERADSIAFKSTLDLSIDPERVRAVLAIDQSLRFFHIRPILFALAEAKISQYGFETRISKISHGTHETSPSLSNASKEEHL